MLTTARILRFFLPLALSWIFMAVEGPMTSAVVARLPFPEVNMAALLVVGSLSLWIESPVIDLLSTSTTLAKDRQHYVMLSRFTWQLMAWVTFAHFLVAFTPIYGFVARDVMNLKPEVATAARPGLMVMLPWSACIGWRRYLQGILIRHGETRRIGLGTAVRVATMGTTAYLLYRFSTLPSVVTASCALVAAVFVEALFVQWASRPVIREHRLNVDAPTDEPPLTARKLRAFHFPLTATTMVNLLGMPMIAAAIARTPNAVPTMAAYQVAGTVLFLFRTTTFAMPEVVITLAKDEASARALRNFCVTLGLALSVLLASFAFTPLDDLVFQRVLGTNEEIAHLASFSLLIGCLMPLLNASQGYVRGMLTANHLTVSRMVAVAVAVTVLIAVLAVGVAAQWPGLVVAGMALTVSTLAELGVLTAAWHRGRAALATRSAGAG